MFLSRNDNEGIPPTLYRSPAEIRRDISKITKEIREADEMLSIRNVLTEMIDELAVLEPSRWIEELEETLAEAREAMERLNRLHEALAELTVELEESKWAKRSF